MVLHLNRDSGWNYIPKLTILTKFASVDLCNTLLSECILQQFHIAYKFHSQTNFYQKQQCNLVFRYQSKTMVTTIQFAV